MIELVKLNENGYTKKYTDGRNTSVVGGYESDEEVQEYIANGGIVEEAYTAEELEAIELSKAKSEAQAYLDSTDWIVIRFTEQGVEIPQEVKDKRQECRELL